MGIGLKYKNNKNILEERERFGVPYLAYPLLEATGIVEHGFSTRLGGVSKGDCSTMNLSVTRGDDMEAVEENRRRIAKAIGVSPGKMVFTHQTHTVNVAQVMKGDEGKRFMETDGMVTNVPGICLVTFYADCVPLFFVDPVKRAIGLSHSGWRGTVKKMGKVTVEHMTKAYGTDPGDVIAAVGPSICQDCYEVSRDVAEQFLRNFGEERWKDILFQRDRQIEGDKRQLDLWKANEYVLMEAGIKKENIAVANVCTHCNPKLLFSHRAAGEKRGNLSALLALKEERHVTGS